MSIWKSPVFYFGILLLLAVTAAVIAPFVVDWNRYKSDLEAYGERLSGRNVQINGPVSVRLFPFPRLQAEFVDLGNTDDPDKGNFASAEKIVVRVGLDGLFAGQLRVEEVTFEKPVFDLERKRDGAVNWIIQPQETLKNSPLLDQVRLDHIILKDATIRLLDEQRLFQIAFDDVDATLSAQQIVGPWRSVGTGTVFGQRADFVFTSTTYSDAEPLRVGLKLSPHEKTWPTLAFDGAIHNREAKGKLRLDPSVVEEGKGNPEGRFRPLVLQANVAARSDAVELSAIRITPADTKDGSTLIEGSVKAQLSDRITAEATFDAARLNLDAVFGAESLQVWRASGLLGFIDQIISRFPDRLDLKADLKASILTAAQETLENVEIAAEVASGNVRLRRVSANLPGRSRILADGIAFTGQGGTEFGGKLALESNDLRLLTGWIWPGARTWIASHWTGSRGQLKLQGNVDWSGQRLALKNLDYELDGAGGSLSLTANQSDTRTTEVQAQISKLDLDSYLPRGLAMRAGEGQVSWTSLLQAVTASGQNQNTRLALSAKSLVLNGTTSQDVYLTTQSEPGSVTLESFSIGSVGSAQLTAEGRMTESEGAYEGEVTAGLSADDPNNFLRLIGVAAQTSLAPWQKQLGRTDATARFIMQRGTDEPSLTVALDAKSGQLTLAATSDFSSLTSPEGVLTKGVAEVTSPDGAQLLRLFGLEAQPVAAIPGKLSIAFEGQPKSGYALDSKLEALAAIAGFSGTYQFSASSIPTLDGKLSIAADDAAQMIQAIGFPGASSPGKFKLDMVLKPQLEALLLEALSGTAGASSFAGTASISANGAVSLDISGGALNLAQVAAPALMQWIGTSPTLDSNFNGTSPFGIKGEVWLRPESMTLLEGIEVQEAVIGMQFDDNNRLISLAGRNADGDPVSLELALQPAGSQFTLTGSGKVPLDLAAMKSTEAKPLVNGKAELSFKASGNGLTPIAALSDATGKGVLKISGASLLNFSPDTFATLIKQVKSGDDLRNAVSSLRSNQLFALPDQSIPLTFAAGRITADQTTIASPATAITINAEADILEQTLSAKLQMKLKEPEDLPAVNLQFAGPPTALRQRLETSELAGKLGYEIMAREMAELERVQAEQQRALEEEEAQRVQDQVRYQAYLEQRAELRLRQRELKVHATERSRRAAESTERITAGLPEWAAMTKIEIARRIRETRIFQGMANGGISKPVKSRRVAPTLLEDLPQGFELPQ